MKLNPKTIEILIPSNLRLEATNKMTLKEKSITISSSLVKKMGSPEYVRFYVDKEARLFFIVPCKPEAEGARKFYRPKNKTHTVYFASKLLAKQLAEIAKLNLKGKTFTFDAEDVDDRETALGFNLARKEAK